ncbi:protein FAM76A isoform X1 [Drosophila sulfurigaster albostrigata]|uniref:Protein FAM76A isoform X1 n=1 Tax=Drosophila albomicans TaxID=7291 RepID=A0A6P8WLP5_DROAB|nr:protein FAM76A isoform X1 [Drosophila albomicans]XP_060660173.1 protein FAM76A isoform X1 [Drosophila nasuta]XP_062131473.1 protein FAM76A isoform X1 [Drosophila sulfurigaster albostrigata]
MSGKVLFACSKCFSRHPYEELSSGQQLCKVCRGSTSVVKCTYCRSEFPSASKSQSACKKCEHYLGKYGKPTACECCKIVAAFGSSKCMRCASYEAKYGPPTQCDECKLRSAFDRRDENKKVNGKILCWLCTCAYKRALLKAQQEGRISMSKKRPHEKSSSSSAHRDSSSQSAKKPTRGGEIGKNAGNNNAGGVTAVSGAGLDLPDKISRGNGGGNGTIAAPAAINVDTNSSDHVVAITYLKERIASLEKRLNQKDKELLEKDKQLTELKGKNFEKENDMRNRLKEVERLHDMKVDNLNRKVASLLKELAVMKKSGNNKQKGGAIKAEKEAIKRENLSPKEEIVAAAAAVPVVVSEKQASKRAEPERDLDKDEKSRDRDEERNSDQDRGSVHSRSGSSSPSSN